MRKIYVDFSKTDGVIKPHHATNNGPVCPHIKLPTGYPMGGDGNLKYFKEAGIPYARNHDASHASCYGGCHVVDVNCIFTNFDADENDPTAYDFVLTDKIIEDAYDAGTKIFYRLGASIEHWKKKYNVHPPKDFAKWARICEHIIMHYNEGWADGFHYGIEYWEIWNEPDTVAVCGMDGIKDNMPTWTGTLRQFVDFYCTASKHLKERFPNLKIGGPAASTIWCDKFWDALLPAIKERGGALDFMSWHLYNWNPKALTRAQNEAKRLLEVYGFPNAESICNEYNYVKNWFGDKFFDDMELVSSYFGAAYMAGSICEAQTSGLDMLMYYDARPSLFNGLFDERKHPKKTYYVFKMFNELYKLKNYVPAKVTGNDIHAIAAKNEGKQCIYIARYNEDLANGVCKVEVSVDNVNFKKAKLVVVDKYNTETVQDIERQGNNLIINMRRHSAALITLE